METRYGSFPMNWIRRAAAIVLACLLLLGLTACKAIPTRAEQFTALVRGNLDEIYLGRADSNYLKLTGSTVEDVKANYESSLLQEADFFCGYFGISHPTESVMAEVTELYRQIYSHASYTVGEAVKADEKTYTVKVEIQPLNIMDAAIQGHDEALAGFYEKYTGVSPDDLSGEELTSYEADWADAVIEMVRAQISHTTYRSAETVDVRVMQDGDGTWQMNAEDLQTVDALILYYPSN